MAHHITVCLDPIGAILQNAVDSVVQACAEVICFGPWNRAGRPLHLRAINVSKVSSAKSGETRLQYNTLNTNITVSVMQLNRCETRTGVFHSGAFTPAICRKRAAGVDNEIAN